LFGFDGYQVQQGHTNMDMLNENQAILNKAAAAGIRLVSLTPTRYTDLPQVSIFHLITKHSA
jgi:hypothetical protein